MIYLYLVTCFLWACYAVKMNIKQGSESHIKNAITFVLNLILCPITIGWAIIKT